LPDEQATIEFMIKAQIARGMPDVLRACGLEREFGLPPLDEPQPLADDIRDLGTCCICGSSDDVIAIVTLPVKSEVPGHGWGCVVCNLPSDGASAVLCATCTQAWIREQVQIKFACRGYPATDGRVP